MKEKSRLFGDLLMQSHGINVSKYDDSFLDKSLQKRIMETHSDSADAYFAFLEQNRDEGDVFVNSLRISYSEFFRNPLTFSVLERIVLPSLILKKRSTTRREIRVWSAACAAGQETYSLVMLLEELISDSDKLTYRVFATDQSESQVNEAMAGNYPAAALNNLNLKRVNHWFTEQGNSYTVNPELKKNIDFSVFDLFNEQLICPPGSIFGDFDLIICANLLFYYKPEYRKKILEKTADCFADGGYLITGETERDILLKHNYREVFPQSAIFQKR